MLSGVSKCARPIQIHGAIPFETANMLASLLIPSFVSRLFTNTRERPDRETEKSREIKAPMARSPTTTSGRGSRGRRGGRRTSNNAGRGSGASSGSPSRRPVDARVHGPVHRSRLHNLVEMALRTKIEAFETSCAISLRT